ncbi:SulP family inorganic anion transporter [Streptomyces rhizosphaerihabitans]|uniref:SulP family inorganic anion transporter n=1 Tax=Streptomyces rhizosphaerihabitans TaxID=1266770 RepID=UPI0021BE465E|nr:SulP family inorganic anion transporter [Streptomyces rhizosphaerihabitans]MCT9011826.1 SulP family inorganic anion transporter [Streptomyces rhizosphaerihabitans]
MTVGLTVAAVAVPAALGMAELAGVNPVIGLWATMLPLAAYAVFGSSRQLIVGPEGTLAALTATTVAPLAAGDADLYVLLAASLALVTGAWLVLAGTLRLGFMADFLSKPVLLGYLNGVSLMIISTQLGKLLGIDVSSEDFFPRLGEVARELGGASLATVALSCSLLVVILLLRRFAPKVPGSLVAVVLATVVSAAFDLKAHGIAVVGDLEGGLPSLGFPRVGLNELSGLVLPAAGLALLAFADGNAIARTFATKNGYEVNANQELVALGASNAVSGISGAFPIGSSGSRTALADDAGGRSQIVGLVALLIVAVVAAFATPLIAPLPKAALGAVVVAAALNLFDFAGILRLRKVRDTEAALAVAALLAVPALGVLNGLLVAVALSMGVFVYRTVRPHDAVLGHLKDVDSYQDVDEHEGAQTQPGLVVYRFDAPLYFPNVPFFVARVRALVDRAPSGLRWLVVNAEAVTYIDATAVDALSELHTELADRGVVLAFARPKASMRRVFADTGLTAQVGEEHLFPSVRAAAAAFQEAAGRG